jgi:hypothetical protein
MKIVLVSSALFLLAVSGCGEKENAGSPLSRTSQTDENIKSNERTADFPVPPGQAKPWQRPASKMPELLVTATEALFRDGLADPRGLEYRQIEVGTGNCWSGDSGTIQTHGWALPAKAGDAGRFAVCWNGLVYPAVSIGEKADIEADVLAVLKAADEESREKPNKERTDFIFYRGWNALPEGCAVSHQTLQPLQAALLLRLGKTELAERVCVALKMGMNENTKDASKHLDDPYLMLATDWAWAIFDRAVCAHMRGDDRTALPSARLLTKIGPAVEAEAGKRGFPARSHSDYDGRETVAPYLSFLGELPELLSDQERRFRNGKRASLTEQVMGVARGPMHVRLDPHSPLVEHLRKQSPDAGKRIAALIEDLEDVAARQWGQPGWIILDDDPVIQLLAAEGDAAVEPLLECLEKDRRLTRSVGFGRDFHRDRYFIPVVQAANVALVKITRFSTSDLRDPNGERLTRKEVAEKFREHLKRFKDVPFHGRWFAALADDQASGKQWLDAAEKVVQPVDVEVGNGWVDTPDRKPGEVPRLRGEPLRTKTNPSVTDLLARRAEGLREMGRPGSELYSSRHDSCRMALILAEWDPIAALPLLSDQIRKCAEWMTDTFQQPYSTCQILSTDIAQMTEARLRAKDPQALDDYADWVRTARPETFGTYLNEAFAPLWQNADHPAIQKAAEWMFNDPASPWCPLFKDSKNAGRPEIQGLYDSPLICVAGFRSQLLRELANKAKAGKTTIDKDRWTSSAGDFYWNAVGVWSGDSLAPPAGTEMPFRVCDLIAYKLSSLAGAPRLDLYWPEQARDEAIVRFAAFLRQYGGRFKFYPKPFFDSGPFGKGKACLSFDRIDHQASVEEAQKVLAVFSLEGEGERRVWKLPDFPLYARWPALKKYPYASYSADAQTGEQKTWTAFHNEGLVWQAEEVLKDGQWKRYYGIVGPHEITKVPAEEIEFPAPGAWSHWLEMPTGVDVQLIPPGTQYLVSGGTNITPAKLGQPLPLVLKLRNRKGIELGLPETLGVKEGGQVRLYPGLEIRLTRASDAMLPGYVDPDYQNQLEATSNKYKWETVTAKPAEGLDLKMRPAGPTGSHDALNLDLKDIFEISKPGFYRMQVSFKDKAPASGVLTGECGEVMFLVWPSDNNDALPEVIPKNK